MPKKVHKTDILVVGGGLAGLAAAVFLESHGHKTAIVLGDRRKHDARTTALLNESVEFFKSLDLWEALRPDAHPLKTMRIVDGTKRLIRAPQVDFHSSEIGLEAFGYNLPNESLLDVLSGRLDASGKTMQMQGTIAEINESGQVYRVTVKGNRDFSHIEARILIGADGRNSAVRNFLGVGETRWSYPQSALVFDFEHQYSSNFTSTEFHTETGPFTIVPQSDRKAGLVWLDEPASALRNKHANLEELARLVEEKMGSFLGKITITGPVQTFPISGLRASRFGQKNSVLIGEAAHVFPPIGAQGFNLGIRDIEEVGQILGTQDTLLPGVGEAYHRNRQRDVNSRTMGVDFMNRTLLSDFMPVQLIRTLGMYSLGKIPNLRRLAMRLGISPKLVKSG